MTQQHFFPDGEDLPLFSGAPVKAESRPFRPAPQAKQEPLFDLRPEFGGGRKRFEPEKVDASTAYLLPWPEYRVWYRSLNLPGIEEITDEQIWETQRRAQLAILGYDLIGPYPTREEQS